MVGHLLVCAAFAPLVVALPAAAQAPTSEQPMSLTPTDGPPETVVTSAGSGCTIGSRQVTVQLTDLGAVLETTAATADEQGRWKATLQIPRTTTPGEYTFLAECENTILYAQQRFDVLELDESVAPAAVDIGQDSRTSTELVLLGILGGLLLVAGVTLVLVDRHRRRARHVAGSSIDSSPRSDGWS